MWKKSTVLAFILFFAPQEPYAATLVWQHEAFSQADIDSYEWRYYTTTDHNGKRDKGTRLRSVKCVVLGLPPAKDTVGLYTCRSTPPKVVGWIRITAKHPRFGESTQSAPIYLPPDMPPRK